MRLRLTMCWLMAGVCALNVSQTLAQDSVRAQRRAFEPLYEVAKRQPVAVWAGRARGLEAYPLFPYLEFAALQRDLSSAHAAEVRAFLLRHDGSLLADDLRKHWLEHLAQGKHWRDLLADWRPQTDLALRCAHTTARIQVGGDTSLRTDALDLWLNGRSLPPACDTVVQWLTREHALDAAHVWRRIELAYGQGQSSLITYLARTLAPSEQALAHRWVLLATNPDATLSKAATWPAQAHTRRAVALAIARLARRDATRAAQHWQRLSVPLGFTESEHGIALAGIALYKAASYEPDAARWLARVPEAAYDDGLREWRVREALARADYAAALAAVAKLSPAQQLDARWRYVRARMLELSGQPGAAQAAFAALAGEANFHGFLAAERVGAPFALCPLPAPDDAALRARVAAEPGLVRAFELRELDWRTLARREWNHTLAKLDDAARRMAVQLAHERGWLERGPYTLLKPQDQRYYELRFPLGYAEEVRAHAKRHRLEPGFVLALMRSESAFMIDARSHADARGLMQLLPSVARAVAKRERQPFHGAADLYRPTVNIALGSAHLADELARYDGRVWLATAAYNAGPAPVRRWLNERADLPNDLWVETIPYRETREYVSRVLAFAVIYDWRLDGRANSLAARLGLSAATESRALTCPADSLISLAPSG
jgi:soluble lytic murein transglycosylase